LIDSTTGSVRTAATSSLGHYRFPAIDPATPYQLTVTSDGFDETRLTVSDLSAGDRRILDLVL
jgi:hypothetical protein